METKTEKKRFFSIFEVKTSNESILGALEM